MYTVDLAENGAVGRGSVGRLIAQGVVGPCARKEYLLALWKANNGFRSGYTSLVEEAIKREFPNSDLKATPHVYSKLTQWKRNYYSLSKMLERSGVEFNERGDYKLDISNDQWEQIVKVVSSSLLL